MGITRLGEVEDIANAARFLCSQESSYMTGECLFVAGKPSPRL
jgi:NAD(P)-dependent dehydrogenase (short-subunit alcohol dehydrogenase family)